MTLKPGDIVELADGTVIGPLADWPGGRGFCAERYYWEPNGEAYIYRPHTWYHRDDRFDVVAVVTVTRKEGEG